MNSLSWMIYLADVASGLSVMLAIVATLAACAVGFSLLWAAIEEDDISMAAPWAKRLLPVAVGCALLAVLIPSPGTVYAIAASETGEAALKSETGGKAVQALNAWLDRQIAGEKEAE
jgi:hypothetical protein